MRLFSTHEALDKELAGVKCETECHLGLVSSDAPLISNLDVLRNIALIYQYHRDVGEKKANAFVLECLKRYGLEDIAYKRSAALSEEQRFLVMLIRAAMVPDAVIVIDRPFKMIPYLKDISFIYENLGKIDDLYTQCHILDLSQDKNRYGMTDAAENRT